MRILIFSTAYLPFVGGAELAIKEITDRLSPGEFSFDLITLNLDGKQKAEEQMGNVRVIRLSCSKVLFPFRASSRAIALHQEKPYDRIWSIMASYGGFAGLFFKRRFPKIPFVLTLQEGDSFAHIYRRVFFIWPLFKMIFTRADHITAISNYLADWAKRMRATCSVEVVPNGVDIQKFEYGMSLPAEASAQAGNIEKEEIRKKIGIQKEDKIVITTSRLVAKNGVGDLIEAMQYLPENVKLVILGTGSLEESLKSKVQSAKLEKRVQFLGFISNQELPQYLHIADIFCRPSLSEGLGISFLEAMAAGLPVIATSVGGILDFLTDGETGLFCEVQNPKSIAEKIQLLLSDGVLRTRIIDNAGKMVRERYEWQGIAEKMKNALTGSM
ncbi:MAG: glycosyltransferase family 1 protein [Candidatus Taylorbacteria bacterium]|nr:glycosyltransferase family 1 protein [Candidatus Taylorbacteria bacterium]